MNLRHDKNFMGILNAISKDYGIEDVKKYFPLVKIYEAQRIANGCIEKIQELNEGWCAKAYLDDIVLLLEEYLIENDKKEE